MQAYNVADKFDAISSISKTFLSNHFQNDCDCLVFNEWKLVRADGPSNLKSAGVCIYYRQTPIINILDITNLHKYLVFDISLISHWSFS